MQRSPTRNLLIEIIPGATVALLGLAVWCFWRHSAPPQQFFVGWLLLLLVIATAAAVARAAFISPPRAMLVSTAALVAAYCALVAAVGVGGGMVGWQQCAAICAASGAWLLLWAECAWTCRGMGPGAASAIALTPAMLLMASPIALMPLVHAAHGAPAAVQLIRHACPFFAVLSACRPAIEFDWSHLPGMYAWSGLGQDAPMLLPSAWVCAGIYAGAAGLLVVGRIMLRILRPSQSRLPI